MLRKFQILVVLPIFLITNLVGTGFAATNAIPTQTLAVHQEVDSLPVAPVKKDARRERADHIAKTQPEIPDAFYSELFMHNHGLGVNATIVAFHRAGIFSFLKEGDPITMEELAQFIEENKSIADLIDSISPNDLTANKGYLHVAMWLLDSIGWIKREGESASDEMTFQLTEDGEIGASLADKFIPVVDFIPYASKMENVLTQPTLIPGKLEELNSLKRARWGIEKLDETHPNHFTHEQAVKYIDGILVGTIAEELEDSGIFDQFSEDGELDLNNEVNIHKVISREEVRHYEIKDKPQLLEAFRTLELEGWVRIIDGHLIQLTDKGRFASTRTRSYGVSVSYLPMMEKVPELLFGNKKYFADLYESGQVEYHIDRTKNGKASGAAHEVYFRQTDKIVEELFNRPIEEQPNVIIDTGAGDGKFLQRIYNTILEKTERGRLIKKDPEKYRLTLIAVDAFQESLDLVDYTLGETEGLPRFTTLEEYQSAKTSGFITMKGDVRTPQENAEALMEQFGIDAKEALHPSSMLFHNRPLTEIIDIDAANKRKAMGTGAYVSQLTHDAIPNNHLEQELKEHFERWFPYLEKYGLLFIELSTIPPELSVQYLSRTLAPAYNGHHGFSNQYTVEASVMLRMAYEAGLMANKAFSKFYGAIRSRTEPRSTMVKDIQQETATVGVYHLTGLQYQDTITHKFNDETLELTIELLDPQNEADVEKVIAIEIDSWKRYTGITLDEFEIRRRIIGDIEAGYLPNPVLVARHGNEILSVLFMAFHDEWEIPDDYYDVAKKNDPVNGDTLVVYSRSSNIDVSMKSYFKPLITAAIRFAKQYGIKKVIANTRGEPFLEHIKRNPKFNKQEFKKEGELDIDSIWKTFLLFRDEHPKEGFEVYRDFFGFVNPLSDDQIRHIREGRQKERKKRNPQLPYLTDEEIRKYFSLDFRSMEEFFSFHVDKYGDPYLERTHHRLGAVGAEIHRYRTEGRKDDIRGGQMSLRLEYQTDLFEKLKSEERRSHPVLWRTAEPHFDIPEVPLSSINRDFIVLGKEMSLDPTDPEPAGMVKTPFKAMPSISSEIGMNVWVKDEGQQWTNSFKPRILAQFFSEVQDYEKRVIFGQKYDVITTGTTGNQGQAVAAAVQLLREKYPDELGHLKAVIYAAQDTPDLKKYKMEKVYGAEVITVDGPYEVAQKKAEAYGDEERVLYMTHSGPESVSSYGTLGLEIVEDLVREWQSRGIIPDDFNWKELVNLKVSKELNLTSDTPFSEENKARLEELQKIAEPLANVAAFVPVGAGGIASGVLVALKHIHPKVKVIGIASDRTYAMYQSLVERKSVKIKTHRRVQEDGINVEEIEGFAIKMFEKLADGMVVVPHEKIEKGIQAHYTEVGITSEGASVLPYLALTEYPELVEKLQSEGVRDIVLVSTGSNIEEDEINRILNELQYAKAA